MSNLKDQHPSDSVPTVTEKSSGLQYESAMQDPAQEKRVQQRENSTKNDKA